MNSKDWRSAILRVIALAVFFSITLAASFSAFCVIWPDISGKSLHTNGKLTVDASNSDDGYVAVRYSKSSKRLKLRIAKGDDFYTYDLNGDGKYEVFSLQMGDGTYAARVYEHVRSSQYALVASTSFRVKLNDENSPYLCPNQYVWYEIDSLPVVKAKELCKGLDDAQDKVDAVYDYITRQMIYDYILALTVKSGYLPDVDDTYESQKGICFDFAATMACMLRSQDVPVKLVIGYADKDYHAWNEALIDGDWVRYDPTSAITGMKYRTYTDERTY